MKKKEQLWSPMYNILLWLASRNIHGECEHISNEKRIHFEGGSWVPRMNFCGIHIDFVAKGGA